MFLDKRPLVFALRLTTYVGSNKKIWKKKKGSLVVALLGDSVRELKASTVHMNITSNWLEEKNSQFSLCRIGHHG